MRGECLPARIPDLKALQFSSAWERVLRPIIDKHRMEWEVWIESAKTYDDLGIALSKRGYKNLPLSGKPMVHLPLVDKQKTPLSRQGLENLGIKGQKTMMRKSKKRSTF